MEEHFFQCPYCREDISILLDPSIATQTLIEDCEVCCNPMEINVGFLQMNLTYFECKDLGQ